MSKFDNAYDICVIDIGSPKKGNLGWCFIDVKNDQEYAGSNLDDMFPHIINAINYKGLILGLEAPFLYLFVRTWCWPQMREKGKEQNHGRPELAHKF